MQDKVAVLIDYYPQKKIKMDIASPRWFYYMFVFSNIQVIDNFYVS